MRKYFLVGAAAALVAYAVSVSLLVVRYDGRPGPTAPKAAAGCGGKSDPGETASPPGETNAAEKAEANGSEGWFTRGDPKGPWLPPNPNTKLVSVDELLAPCNGGKRAENVVAFNAYPAGQINDPRLALASVDGKYWADLGVNGRRPEFSPDGTKIAYRAGGVGGLGQRLYVANADGSGITVLSDAGHSLTGYGLSRCFAFTPDSRAVVYTAGIEKRPGGELTYGLFLADVAGPGRRLIHSSEEYLDSPSLPASGDEIAFQKGSYIYVINVDGSGLRRVTDPAEGHDEYPAFSPDGSKIAFRSGDHVSADHEMAFDVYVVNADGTGRHNLTADDTRDEQPYFSRDGKRVVFQSWEGGITVADVNTFELRRVPSTGGPGCLEDFITPCFSPDGGKIAYDSVFSETGREPNQIYVINADGTGNTWISPGGEVYYVHPSFSPMRVDGVLFDTYGGVIEE
jgi:Tol biopolymer transport system component